MSDLPGALTAAYKAIRRLKSATAMLTPYEKSPDERIRLTAQAFCSAFDSVSLALEEMAALTSKALSAAKKEEFAELITKMSAVTARIDDGWRSLTLGVVALTHALIDPSRNVDGKLAFLRISVEERQRLLLSLKKLFPNAELKAGQHVVEASMGLLREWLVGPWKASDER